MAKDEFKIIISKTGEIKVVLDGLTEQKIKSYTQIFEDVIGPVKQVIDTGGTLPPASPSIVDADADKEKTKI